MTPLALGRYTLWKTIVPTDDDLKFIEKIRARPGLYFGSGNDAGLHRYAFEAVNNSTDEALTGRCRNIQVKIHVDGSISVDDDGQGIPVAPYPSAGISTLELVLSKMRSPALSGGVMHGVHLMAVNACSEWLHARICRDGGIFEQRYQRGMRQTEVLRVGDSTEHGTHLCFKPDARIFRDATFDFGIISNRLREFAFLIPGLTTELVDERSGESKKFYYINGMRGYFRELNAGLKTFHDPIIECYGDCDDIFVEISFQYVDSDATHLQSFVNNIATDGGTHVDAFMKALRECICPAGVNPTDKELQKGLVAVVSVKTSDVQFDSPTVFHLANGAMELVVEPTVAGGIRDYFSRHPGVAEAIAEKIRKNVRKQ
jgi:DNA gyrase subunit B